MFQRTRHFTPAFRAWDEVDAKAAIAEIAADAVSIVDPTTLWPAHPMDDGVRDGHGSLYFGAAGVIWALDYLRREQVISDAHDLTPLTTTALERNAPWFATRGGPGAAAEVRKWTRAMFQFAVEVGLRPDNPFTDVRNRDKQRSRDRVLSMGELAAVWMAAGSLNYPWGPYYRLILLTGDRRGEWANARWDWLDKGCERLEIPAAQYKTGKAQVVPLRVLSDWGGRGQATFSLVGLVGRLWV